LNTLLIPWTFFCNSFYFRENAPTSNPFAAAPDSGPEETPNILDLFGVGGGQADAVCLDYCLIWHQNATKFVVVASCCSHLKQQWTNYVTDYYRPLLPQVMTFYNFKEILLPT